MNVLSACADPDTEAKDVYLDVTRHSELRHQQGVIVKGRELVALVMQSFRTCDRTDLVNHIEHLFNLDGLCVYSDVVQLTLAYATRMLKQQPPHQL